MAGWVVVGAHQIAGIRDAPHLRQVARSAAAEAANPFDFDDDVEAGADPKARLDGSGEATPLDSGRPHPLDELLAGAAFQQPAAHLVDVFGVGELREQLGQTPGRLLAESAGCQPAQNPPGALPRSALG